MLQKSSQEKIVKQYSKKEKLSEIYKTQGKKCDIWLDLNLRPRKTSAIMSMIEQMIETRVWKEFRGHTETGQYSLGDEE